MQPQEISCLITLDNCQNKPSQLLAQASSLSVATVKDAMQKGAVWLVRGNKKQRLRRASNTPAFVNSTNDSLFYDPRDKNNYTFNKAFMGINEVEFLQLMSKHLPKWSYFYIAPSKLKLDQKTKLEAPAVINDGEIHFFIKKV